MRIKIEGHTTIRRADDDKLLEEWERAQQRPDSPFKTAWLTRIEAELARR